MSAPGGLQLDVNAWGPLEHADDDSSSDVGVGTGSTVDDVLPDAEGTVEELPVSTDSPERTGSETYSITVINGTTTVTTYNINDSVSIRSGSRPG